MAPDHAGPEAVITAAGALRILSVVARRNQLVSRAAFTQAAVVAALFVGSSPLLVPADPAATETLPQFPLHQIGADIGMTPGAMRFASMPRTRALTPQGINTSSHGFKVPGIYARAVPTKMVQVQTGRDGTSNAFVNVSVGGPVLPFDFDVRVPRAVRGHPFPATVLTNDVADRRMVRRVVHLNEYTNHGRNISSAGAG